MGLDSLLQHQLSCHSYCHVLDYNCRYWLINYDHDVPDISDLQIFCGTLESLYLCLSLFWPFVMHIVSSFTPAISESKVHLHLWSNRKMASFRFLWAITQTCCPMLGIPSAYSLLGLLRTLQILSTFLSIGTQSLSGLSSPCCLISKLDVSGLNYRQTYISLNH